MQVVDTAIAAVKIIEPRVFGDERGFFMETFREDWFKANVCDVDFVQDNHSMSGKGILRGLHYQLSQPQGKLVRCVSGRVIDVAVDMRRSSASFGQHVAVELSAENKRQLWVPAGFAHGFAVLSDSAEFVYRCTDYYAPQDEHSMQWDDADLNINWQLGDIQPRLSDKDAQAKPFKQAASYE
ncbi:dTDP-4-dehydrorhamnose 3,5-epimerase [Alteromonas oceanisediminis]|uniref:dTDP-4-dehydrorhamnose 3,5-epimerase n=1 Tax=Alteromonas oceanisediminis TaxID=2836180 RepID=UPI001BD9481A|nr:dTDP-4-dehydrorhamnose 3,5-epimerase [Alteromonas oceanisediminis]MBT0585694.1 dTDP-4-dehydrorhamnose 3,5-epimerase [Alteromonas oceanisediminis]